MGCRLDAIGAGAEINPVEIELEDFGLGMLALQPQREFGFLQFALQGALLGQEQVLGELLGQRRAALRHAAAQEVGHGRTQDAVGVDAVNVARLQEAEIPQQILPLAGQP